MAQIIIDMIAKKAKEVECPICGETAGVSLYNHEGDFECRNCDNIFELSEYERTYDECDEGWRDLDEGEKIMLGEE